MPYIKDENNRRQELKDGAVAETAGELNFQIFTYVKYQCLDHKIVDELKIIDYCKSFLGKNPNYQRYNDVVGCLYLCEKELKRRSRSSHIFRPSYEYPVAELIDLFLSQIYNYEDEKIVTNGDV